MSPAKHTTRKLPHKSVWKVLAGLLVALVALAAYVAGRGYLLLGRSRLLIARSEKFPTDYFVGQKGQAPLTYFVLGDSTAVGVGTERVEESYPYQIADYLAKQGHHVHVINLAQSGARWEDVELKQLPALARLTKKEGALDVLTLTVGANDATHRTSVEDYHAHLKNVLEQLGAYSKARLLIADTPDMALVPALQPLVAGWIGHFAQRQNEALRSEMAGKALRMVPLYERGKLDERQDSALYAADHFHPSRKGYARWAALFIEALKQ